MEYHLGVSSLFGIALYLDNGTMLNVFQIDVIDDYCKIKITIADKEGTVKSIYRKGKHKNMIFQTSVDNLPITVNLETGVIKRIRDLNTESDPSQPEQDKSCLGPDGISIKDSDSLRFVSIENRDILRVSKDFAEKNLSPVCIGMADGKTDTLYKWTFEETAYAVVFELPALFEVKGAALMGKMLLYCPQYFIQVGIHGSEDIPPAYEQNLAKELVY